jgi:hypothetical protein
MLPEPIPTASVNKDAAESVKRLKALGIIEVRQGGPGQPSHLVAGRMMPHAVDAQDVGF